MYNIFWIFNKGWRRRVIEATPTCTTLLTQLPIQAWICATLLPPNNEYQVLGHGWKSQGSLRGKPKAYVDIQSKAQDLRNETFNPSALDLHAVATCITVDVQATNRSSSEVLVDGGWHFLDTALSETSASGMLKRSPGKHWHTYLLSVAFYALIHWSYLAPTSLLPRSYLGLFCSLAIRGSSLRDTSYAEMPWSMWELMGISPTGINREHNTLTRCT